MTPGSPRTGRVAVRGPAVFRHAGQYRELPDRVSVHLVNEGASCAADWRLFCPESWDDAGWTTRWRRPARGVAASGPASPMGCATGEVAAGAGHDR